MALARRSKSQGCVPRTNGDGGVSQGIGNDNEYADQPARRGWVSADDGEFVWRSSTIKSSYWHKDKSSCMHDSRGGPLITTNVHLGPVMLSKHKDRIVRVDGTIEVRLDKIVGTRDDIESP